MGSSGRAIEAIGTRLVTRHIGDVRGLKRQEPVRLLARQWTGRNGRLPALPFAFADNYLIGLKAAIILDIKVTHAHTHQHGS
jgi:hypothetical protein